MRTEFGTRLRKTMEEKHITQEKLSSKTGLTTVAISYICGNRGINPSYESLVKICKALDVSADYLLFGKGEV